MALQDGFNSILLSVTEKSIELKQSCRTMNESYSNYSNVKTEDLKLSIKNIIIFVDHRAFYISVLTRSSIPCDGKRPGPN